MNRISFVIPLLIIIAMSGCISSLSNEADISKNPENYLNESVKIQGKLDRILQLTLSPHIDWDYILVDKQGYKFPIKLPSESREFYVGENYELLGKVRKLDYCICQRRFVDVEGDFVALKVYDYIKNTAPSVNNFTCDKPIPMFKILGDINGEWEITNYYTTVKEASSSCISRGGTVFTCKYNYESETYQDSFKDEYRCNPETIETFYYIESETMTKI